MIQRILNLRADVLVAYPPGDLGICTHPFRRVDVDATDQLALCFVEQRVVERQVRSDLALVMQEILPILLAASVPELGSRRTVVSSR